ncbi:MAG: DsbA family protein [Burkholderiales bacterium]|nr:DsbA family protein [Burkholderiales bacterium]
MTHLIYIADPMCSWCYGFGPELQALLDSLPEARLDVVLGGLRAYNTEASDAATAEMILGHWRHVAGASGLPFTMPGLMRPGFVYDTEPACRAVVAARTLADDMPSQTMLTVLRAIQHAFYAEAQDVTDLRVLAQICVNALNTTAGGAAFDVESFLETLSATMTMAETRADFEQSQRWGIRGFPALLLVHQEGLHLIASGYCKTAQLQAMLRQVQEVA